MNACPCSVCGEGGHHPRACPTLWAPLKSGFYAPPAGHRPSGDDDDEHLGSIKLKKCFVLHPVEPSCPTRLPLKLQSTISISVTV